MPGRHANAAILKMKSESREARRVATVLANTLVAILQLGIAEVTQAFDASEADLRLLEVALKGSPPSSDERKRWEAAARGDKPGNE